MKITKFLLFSFLCFLVSCSDENPVDYNSSNREAFKTKNGSELTVEQVDYLKNQLSIIVQSQAWADKQAAIGSFSSKMNLDTTEFTDREDLKKWLTEGGLSKTGFSSVTEGLEIFDNAVAKTELVVNENLAFFELLSHADLKQGETILNQLLIPGPDVVPNGGHCESACLNDVDNCINVVGIIYTGQIMAATKMPLINFMALTLVLADHTYWIGMTGCTVGYNYCLGKC